MIPPETTVGELGERRLLAHLRSRIPTGGIGVLVGMGDDAAVVFEGAGQTLLTTDTLVEGVHFRREWAPPRLLGRKALTVNLSDIAAMAGTPRHATVSLCLPPETTLGFVDELYDGLLERAAETGVNIVGGNLSSGPVVVIHVSLLGAGERFLRRSGAEAGDLLVVTGVLGGAAEGLRLLIQGARLNPEGMLENLGPWTESSRAAVQGCLRTQLDPAPPLAFAKSLSEQELVHAAIDLSDGLSGDLLALCAESGLGAEVEAAAVPVDPAVTSLERARGGDALALALHGGEDYQLLLALPPDRLDGLKDLAVVWDLPLAVVGSFSAGRALVSLKSAGLTAPLPPRSHEHFSALPRP